MACEMCQNGTKAIAVPVVCGFCQGAPGRKKCHICGGTGYDMNVKVNLDVCPDCQGKIPNPQKKK